MKILQVMAGGEHGGAETAFVDMCIAMRDSGAEIEVATRPNRVRVPALEAAGIKVHALPFGGPLDVFTKFRLKRIIRTFQPDIVLSWMARAAQKTPNWRENKAAKPYATVARLGGYYKQKNFSSADYFIGITPDLCRHIEAWGVAKDRVRLLNNFAETETDVVPVHMQDFGIPVGATVTVSLGRLHSSKAYDVLLQSLTELPNVYALIAGEGPDRHALEQLAEKLGVEDRVRFLGWRTDRSALLRAADICVFASRVEPFGTVFAQAWAERTPVVVSDADGPRQFCRDGEDSLVVPRENPQALAVAIRRLADDPALRQRLVDNGYRRYRDEFTKEKSVAAYRDFFSEIMSKQNRL